MILGGVEAGGTKWVCALADDHGRVLASRTLATTTPHETLAAAVAFFHDAGAPEAIGIAAFGPIDLRPSSPTYGQITTTPKPGWAYTDIVTPFRAGFDVPVVLDTDVNAAAVGEGRWGAGVGLETFSYVTVGTGIGGGAIVNGRVLHGLFHPELGHIRIPHDRERDPFEGSCPYHGDCFEGLASGEALRRRWGRRAEALSFHDVAWELEAEYLALGVLNLVHTLSPQRIVLGGGVVKQAGLLPGVQAHLSRLVGGYLDLPALAEDGVGEYVVRPQLGDRSGVLGAIELARRVATRNGDEPAADVVPGRDGSVDGGPAGDGSPVGQARSQR